MHVERRLIIVVVLFAFGANARTSQSPPTAGTEVSGQSKLNVISVTAERLEAEFYTPTGGIHILSEVRNGGETVRLFITSTSGEPIFAVDRPLYSSALLSIVGNDFLFVNETLENGDVKLTEYVVPPGYSRRVLTAIKRNRLPKVLRHLHRETINATGRSAIEELLMRPEVPFIEEAAFALGNTGLHGVNNPAAMAFYSTALRFAKVDENEGVASGLMEEELPAERRDRRWLFRRRRYCTNSRSRCYNCPIESDCLGLCGRGCRCWWFVCFDCCYNIGCYLHDKYGCSNTLQCWVTAPIGLVCTPGL